MTHLEARRHAGASPERVTMLVEDGAVVATTRIRFRHPLLCFRAWLRFRKLYGGARTAPGFIRGCASVVNPSTLVNISVWTSRRSMLLWAGTRPHVAAVQWTYGRTREVWSADWILRHASPSALSWEGPVDGLEVGVSSAAARSTEP